jgi:hypothetical protein
VSLGERSIYWRHAHDQGGRALGHPGRSWPSRSSTASSAAPPGLSASTGRTTCRGMSGYSSCASNGLCSAVRSPMRASLGRTAAPLPCSPASCPLIGGVRSWSRHRRCSLAPHAREEQPRQQTFNVCWHHVTPGCSRQRRWTWGCHDPTTEVAGRKAKAKGARRDRQQSCRSRCRCCGCRGALSVPASSPSATLRSHGTARAGRA